MKRIFKEVDDLDTPVKIYAAEKELVVNPKSTTKFAEKAQKKGKDLELIIVEGAMHEILVETDERRNQMLRGSLNFFGKN